MAAQGVTDLALTPHLDASRVLEGPPPAHDEAFAALSKLAPPGITLHRGAELMLDRALTPRAVATRRVTLGGTRYLLVEFPRLVTAAAAERALRQVVDTGLVPLLAHPERYRVCSPTSVRRWRQLGALIQVDANTVFQATARGERARQLLAEGLADVLAADNHGDERSLAEPFAKLREVEADDVATTLMVINPEAILADRATEPVDGFTLKRSVLDRFKRWLGEMRE
jgi:protein-tyrosine phosphatase